MFVVNCVAFVVRCVVCVLIVRCWLSLFVRLRFVFAVCCLLWFVGCRCVFFVVRRVLFVVGY